MASTRTPEGEPNRCTICGYRFRLEPSEPPGDGTCPACGQLLWWFRDRLSKCLDAPKERIALESSFVSDLGAHSLDIVELVMEMEEAFDITISDEDAERIRTVEDAIRYLKRVRPPEAEAEEESTG